jgi:hypothetical protein
VFILNASAAEVPRESGRGLEIKTNQHFCFSLSRRRKTKERRKHNDGLVGTSVIVLPLLYMLYGISAGPAEMRQMLVHFRVSEKSNKKQDNGKEKLKS